MKIVLFICAFIAIMIVVLLAIVYTMQNVPPIDNIVIPTKEADKLLKQVENLILSDYSCEEIMTFIHKETEHYRRVY